jgi:Uma2 family endonuclease
MATVAETLLTAEEYARTPDPGHPTELVRGRVIAMTSPGSRHGQICNRIGRLLGNLAEEHDLGHVLNNDSGVVTTRRPDSVRGPDVAFYSFTKVPRGPLPDGYLGVPPEIVFEVLSPDDRWPKMLAKVAEYLEAGVLLVCVVDPRRSTVQLYRIDGAEPVVLANDDEFSAPEILGELRIPVRKFFE